MGRAAFPVSWHVLDRLGVLPVRNHYYEPFVDPKDLYRPLDQNRLLRIDMNVDRQVSLLREFQYNHELLDIPVKLAQPKPGEFYHLNRWFGAGDAEILYSVIRRFRPKRIVEVGSGYSTLIALKALQRNAAEGSPCRMVCIEPYENRWLKGLDIELITMPVQRIPMSWFLELEANDILFIDSSHVVKPQSDVVFLYLEILPVLNPGVLVHSHDIFTPRDYPEEWVLKRRWLCTEQYLLEAFLLFNNAFEVVLALNYLKHNRPEELRACCPILDRHFDRAEPKSFWIRRISEPIEWDEKQTRAGPCSAQG